MLVNIRIPAPSSMLVMNLLGLLGLVGVAVAVGGLTHNVWWAVLVASSGALVMSIVAATYASTVSQSGEAVDEPSMIRSRAA